MTWRVVVGDALEVLRVMEAESVQCVVTSPPYWGLRDYGAEGQLGLEATPEEYVGRLVEVFREVHRVLRKDGTVWIVLGDSYANDGKWGGSSSGKHVTALHGETGIGRRKRRTGLKPKDLVGIPWRVALTLQSDGWYLRSDIIWSKPNPMPESVKDRPTKAHEYVFLLSKNQRYYYGADAGREEGAEPDRVRNDRIGGARGHTVRHSEGGMMGASTTRNRRTVWEVATQSFPGAHFATFPEKLVEPCVLAGCPAGGTILDPFCGAGTVGVVALRHGRGFVGIELNREYAAMAERRIRGDAPLFNGPRQEEG